MHKMYFHSYRYIKDLDVELCVLFDEGLINVDTRLPNPETYPDPVYRLPREPVRSVAYVDHNLVPTVAVYGEDEYERKEIYYPGAERKGFPRYDYICSYWRKV